MMSGIENDHFAMRRLIVERVWKLPNFCPFPACNRSRRCLRHDMRCFWLFRRILEESALPDLRQALRDRGIDGK